MIDSVSNRKEYQARSWRGKAKLACKTDSLTGICVWTDCLENVGAPTSYKPIGLQGLLRG
jgi:hypothetical protein